MGDKKSTRRAASPDDKSKSTSEPISKGLNLLLASSRGSLLGIAFFGSVPGATLAGRTKQTC